MYTFVYDSGRCGHRGAILLSFEMDSECWELETPVVSAAVDGTQNKRNACIHCKHSMRHGDNINAGSG